jgi:aspartate/methionine/tyrosine aminotransferase
MPPLSDRMIHFDSSGIRKVFDLAARMKDPINLSIGQPHFDVPPSIQQAAIDAIQGRKNGYSPTQGAPALFDKLQARITGELNQPDRRVLVTSGTSGGLVLALLALVNPGDEVLVFDPYFVVYPSLVALAGGKCVLVDTYPDFQIDLDRVQAAITPRTKLVLFNSPANPTGAVASPESIRGLAELCAQRDIVLLSDEIYRAFCYEPFVSPARYNPQTLVIDGFSKTYGVTGWRLGYAHGPAAMIDAMTRLQQYTYVCAPHPLQWAAIEALDVDMTPYIEDYRRKRDLLIAGLRDDYEIVTPGGSFYVFPRVPWGTGQEFVARAIENQLLIIPGGIFSGRDTHFRISYAAEDSVIERGIEVLRRIARQG